MIILSDTEFILDYLSWALPALEPTKEKGSFLNGIVSNE